MLLKWIVVFPLLTGQIHFTRMPLSFEILKAPIPILVSK